MIEFDNTKSPGRDIGPTSRSPYPYGVKNRQENCRFIFPQIRSYPHISASQASRVISGYALNRCEAITILWISDVPS